MQKTVYICDRCGNEYDPAFVLQNFTIFRITKVDSDDPIGANMDLCEECHKGLIKWLLKEGKK